MSQPERALEDLLLTIGDIFLVAGVYNSWRETNAASKQQHTFRDLLCMWMIISEEKAGRTTTSRSLRLVFGLSPASCHELTEMLVDWGWITKDKPEEGSDGREKPLRSTEKGRAELKKLKTIPRRRLERLFHKLDAGDLSSLASILEKVRTAAEEIVEDEMFSSTWY